MHPGMYGALQELSGGHEGKSSGPARVLQGHQAAPALVGGQQVLAGVKGRVFSSKRVPGRSSSGAAAQGGAAFL